MLILPTMQHVAICVCVHMYEEQFLTVRSMGGQHVPYDHCYATKQHFKAGLSFT